MWLKQQKTTTTKKKKQVVSCLINRSSMNYNLISKLHCLSRSELRTQDFFNKQHGEYHDQALQHTQGIYYTSSQNNDNNYSVMVRAVSVR